MGYNKKAYIQTKEIFKAREDKAREDAFMRKCEVEAAIPEVREINNQLAAAGAEIAIELAKGSENIEERINALRDKNLMLQEKRAELLKANGYPADYTKPRFKCEKCEDSGFVDMRVCDCFHREVVENTIRNSGIGALVDKQTLESFDLKYYSYDPKVLIQMKGNLEQIKKYIDNFKPSSSSLIFMGATGLGKTHLSTAIAKAVIEKDMTLCMTAPRISSVTLNTSVLAEAITQMYRKKQPINTLNAIFLLWTILVQSLQTISPYPVFTTLLTAV